jgi:glycosyltransferase involved in cell wall biosynthesis
LSRLAWFTPLPPARSGIAQYSLELLPGLSSAHEIDVFVDQCPDDGPISSAAGMRVLGAHDFIWTHLQRPYDLIVYQMGNGPCHDYMWAYLTRYPGLVVLHDGVLHHARAKCLLRQGQSQDYLAELRYCHPNAKAGLGELGIAGWLGSLSYLLPLRKVVVETARLILVHNHWLAREIRDEIPGTRVEVIEMGVPTPETPRDSGQIVRARHRIPSDSVLFAAFGQLAPEKRIAQILRALKSLAATVPNAHLLLVGGAVDHYDAQADAASLGLGDRVTVSGFVADNELPLYVAAADVCLCLRWPSSGETSAAWLRCLAAGQSTVITDLAHTVDIPALDPRSWALLHAVPAGSQPFASADAAKPACVSIDIVDENHSLALAMHRLAADSRLRAALGSAARQLWSERFTLEGMVDGYRRVIDEAVGLPTPVPSRSLPAHLLSDGTAHAAALLQGMGLPETNLDEFRRTRRDRLDVEGSARQRLAPDR